MNQTAYDMIGRHEGTRRFVYLDSEKIPTIGKGRNLRDKGLAPDEIELMFQNDLREAEAICSRLCPSFSILTEGRQAALMDLSFMGETSFARFKKMFAAIALEEWAFAANEIRNSKWYRDVGPGRGDDVYNLLLKG